MSPASASCFLEPRSAVPASTPVARSTDCYPGPEASDLRINRDNTARRGARALARLSSGEGAVLQAAEEADDGPEHQEVDQRRDHQRGRVVGQALRLARLVEELG